MAAKKAPMRKVSTKPSSAVRKANAVKKTGSAAAFRKAEEAGKKKQGSKTRTLTRAESIAMGKGRVKTAGKYGGSARDAAFRSGFGEDANSNLKANRHGWSSSDYSASVKPYDTAQKIRQGNYEYAKSMAKLRKPPKARTNTSGKGRTDVYGQSGFGQTQSNIDNNYGKNVEAVGRSALKGISGKKPRKNEPLHGSEHSTIRDQALKGLGLTGAQRRYVEQMMEAVPYRPKRRSK